MNVRHLYWAIVLLLLPALWINLGVLALIDDEGIRSLVALEMKFSGNYISPTINGAYYYNKPPFYNWILLGFFELTGVVNEFTARFPTTLAVIGYGATIFYFFRKHFSFKTAFLTAFIFITCGRILFYDSFLGLIDMSFSWAMFTLFMVVYHQFRKENWYVLFLLSYLLAAIGFLMKGLPAIVFQGLTLLAWFSWKGRFRKLFSPEHLAGGLLFLLLVVGYYALYHQYNDLRVVFDTLVKESSKRTVVQYGWKETIVHLITFPFEMVYHFLPWSLMGIYFFRKGVWTYIREHDFMVFNLLIFLVNILLYWSSPEVYPRYLLMHAPLIFGLYVYLDNWHRSGNTLQYKALYWLFGITISGMALLAFAPLFLPRTQETAALLPKTLLPALAMVFLAWQYWKREADRWVIVIAFLVVFRLVFDLFVLPDRNTNDFGDEVRNTSIAMARKFKDKPMAIYKHTGLHTTNGFYMTNERGAIIPHAMSNFDTQTIYIIDPAGYFDLDYEKVGEVKARHNKEHRFDLGKLRPPLPNH